MSNTYYQPPTINYTPMNQRNGRWNELVKVAKPHPDTAPTTFGYWFNYFWEEARETENLTPGDQARLCEAFFSVFDKTPTGVAQVKADFAKLDDFAKQRILRTILTIGFKRVDVYRHAVDCASLQAEVFNYRGVSQGMADEVKQRMQASGRTITLGFRGDGRSYEDLVASGGFLARARSHGQQVMKDFGFDRPWHPFSLGVYANSLFLRKGHNKDNCLHTVVSIGTEFNELVTYPLLTDPQHFPLCNKPLDQWTETEIGQAKAHRWGVRTIRREGGKLDHIEHDLRIYVVRLDHTNAFSTRAWQQRVGVPNPFPEIAADEVPLRNIVAEILLTRRYFHDGSAFEMFDLEFKTSRLLPDEQTIQWRFHNDPAAPANLKAKLEGLERSAKAYRRDAYARYQKQRTQATVSSSKEACSRCSKQVAKSQMAMHLRLCKG